MSSSFLLIGKERLLKKEFICDLQKKSFQNASDASLNTQEWDLSESGTAADVFGFLNTAPFLAEKRIAVLWQIEKLDEDERKGLVASLKLLPATAVIVFVTEETGTKKSAFLRELESHSVLVACHVPFDKDLPGWVEQRVKKAGGTIESGAARHLVDRAGKDAATLLNAIEQLFVFIHPRTLITAQDIAKLLGKVSEEDIFAVADDLFQKNSKAALEKAGGLFREGVRAPQIIAVLSGQLERMKQASGGTFLGNSFYEQKLAQQLKKISKEGIVRMQKRLLECDLSIKEGRLAERLALEKFILES